VITDMEGIAVITGDHGNADEMFTMDKTGAKKIKTAHTLNPVPFIIRSIYQPQAISPDCGLPLYPSNDHSVPAHIGVRTLSIQVEIKLSALLIIMILKNLYLKDWKTLVSFLSMVTMRKNSPVWEELRLKYG